MAVLLDTYDLGEAEAVVSGNYSKMQFGTTPDGPTHARVVRSTLGSMDFDRFQYGCEFQYEGDPMDGIVLCRVKSGALVHQQPGTGASYCQSGTATAIATRQGVPHSGRILTGEFYIVLIDRSLLASLAATAPRLGTPEAVKLTGGMPMSPGANDQMVKAIDYVVRDVVTNPAAAQSPLAAGAVARYLAASMLAVFPNTALLEPTIEDRHDSSPRVLRRAEAFIDDNAQNDISLVDISEAVHITPRALQYMFHKHRDCTPMNYLRRVRLHHAHQDLVIGNRQETSVGRIAARWGFGHLGRFATSYRQMYGQSPQVTLRREP
jgi:AraC-like DNA-binding protein